MIFLRTGEEPAIPKGWTEVARGPASEAPRVEPLVSFCRYCGYEVRQAGSEIRAFDLLTHFPGKPDADGMIPAEHIEIMDNGRCRKRRWPWRRHRMGRPGPAAMARVKGRSHHERIWGTWE